MARRFVFVPIAEPMSTMFIVASSSGGSPGAQRGSVYLLQHNAAAQIRRIVGILLAHSHLTKSALMVAWLNTEMVAVGRSRTQCPLLRLTVNEM
jgi:hypothetical protein